MYVSEPGRQIAGGHVFSPLKQKGQKLCNSSIDQTLKFKFQNLIDGIQYPIGAVKTNIREMREKTLFNIVNERTN